MPNNLAYLYSLVFLLTSLTACSSQSSKEDMAKELRTIQSWTATAQLVSKDWMRRVVPSAYAKQTLKKTRQELHKEAEGLAKKIPPSYQKKLTKDLQRIEDTLKEIETSIEQGDRQTIAQKVEQLSTEQQAVNTLTKTLGRQP